jgi:hypothetical protein
MKEEKYWLVFVGAENTSPKVQLGADFYLASDKKELLTFSSKGRATNWLVNHGTKCCHPVVFENKEYWAAVKPLEEKILLNPC